MKKTLVISVGGSLISQEKINVGFLRKFRKLILRYVRRGNRFIIICGGGKICRDYQKAARSVARLTDIDIDWLGIHSTRLNAHLIRTIFRDISHLQVIKNPTEKINFREKILVASGWRPKCSTDYDAVLIADNFKIKNIVNLTNTDYVYDKDPKKFRNARPIRQISWKDFRKLLPKKWSPGLNVPFDPVASKKAEKSKIEVAIINGSKLENFDKYLEGKEFVGTVINP